MKIYVASSWRNNYHPTVVKTLRAMDHDVYDFKDSLGFGWHEVDDMYKNWVGDQSIESYLKGLDHPRAIEGFNRDYEHIVNCDILIMVMPCGLSAGLELGYASGMKKPTAVYIPELREPELMIKVADLITGDFKKIEEWVENISLIF